MNKKIILTGLILTMIFTSFPQIYANVTTTNYDLPDLKAEGWFAWNWNHGIYPGIRFGVINNGEDIYFEDYTIVRVAIFIDHQLSPIN